MSRFSLLAACLLLCTSRAAREWTATDGRKVQAEFVSATDTTVTLKLANGQASTLSLARLTAADLAWVCEQASLTFKPGPFAKPIQGRFSHLITGQWEPGRPDDRKQPASGDARIAPCVVDGAKNLDAAKEYPVIVAWHDHVAEIESDGAANVKGAQIEGWIETLIKPQDDAMRPCIILAPLRTEVSETRRGSTASWPRG